MFDYFVMYLLIGVVIVSLEWFFIATEFSGRVFIITTYISILVWPVLLVDFVIREIRKL